jgi:hypothetical protein
MRGAILAIFLFLPFSPARAETVVLVCQNTAGGSFTLRVDYDQKTVSLLYRGGATYVSAPADITEAQVSWDARMEKYAGLKFSGRVNRLSSEASMNFPSDIGGGQLITGVMSGPCRPAAQ